jgi:hypothetical protein
LLLNISQWPNFPNSNRLTLSSNKMMFLANNHPML